jgi:tetratricopeptide (TPR) repeat protein
LVSKDQEPLPLVAARKRHCAFLRVHRKSCFLFALALSAVTFAQTADTFRRKALELAQSKSWDLAVENYRKALAIEPNDADTHYNLALTL